MERILHTHQLVALSLQHLGYRNPGPLGDDFSNFLIRDPVAQQLHFHHFRLAGHIQLPLQLRNLAVLQFGHLAEIPGTAGVLQVNPGLFQLALDLLGAVQSRLLGVPDFLKVGVFALDIANDCRQLFQPLLRRSVGFLFQGLPLDLQLNQPAFEPIQRLWLGIHFHADLAGCFIDQVNGLIRQLAIGNVSVRQLGGRDDGTVGDLNPVVNLIALFQPTQDGNGIFLTGLADQHLLETALQCCVFFNIFPVLIQRGGADTVQLTPGQRRL